MNRPAAGTATAAIAERCSGSLRGEEELLGARIAWGAQWPVVAQGHRNIVQLGIDNHDALDHRRQPDGADLIDIVCPDAEQLLGRLYLSVVPHGSRRVDKLHQ